MYYEDKNPIAAKSIFWVLFAGAVGLIGGIGIVLAGAMAGMGAAALFIGCVLIIVGCVYPLVVMTKLSSELNEMCEGDGEHLMPYICACLLGCITFGIYYIYYLYRMQNRLNENASRYNITINEGGGTIIVWFLVLFILFGIGPLVSLAIIIKNFNKMAYAYNDMLLKGDFNGDLDNDAYEHAPEITGDVICLSGDIKGAVINMSKAEPLLIIGRDPLMANIVLNDAKISKQHCILRFDSYAGCFYVQDCNSTNGTTLSSGIKLTPEIETKIENGVELVLPHDIRFAFEVNNNKNNEGVTELLPNA